MEKAVGQILVRNLDDRVIERLKERARRENASLEHTLRKILTEAAKPSRAQIIAEVDLLRKEIGSIRGDSTDLIREDRDNDEPYR
jgi:antitoxin FitA